MLVYPGVYTGVYTYYINIYVILYICCTLYIYKTPYIYNHITIFMVYLLAIRTHPPDQPAAGQGTQQSQPFRGSEGSNGFFTTE